MVRLARHEAQRQDPRLAGLGHRAGLRDPASSSGFLTPFAAAGYVGVLFVAGWTNHRPKGFWSDAGWEYVFILATFAVFIAAVGPGKHSLDWAIGFEVSFQPFTAFAIAVVLGLASGIGLVATCFRPAAPTDA
jgi:putative oxidoreductase